MCVYVIKTGCYLRNKRKIHVKQLSSVQSVFRAYQRKRKKNPTRTFQTYTEERNVVAD